MNQSDFPVVSPATLEIVPLGGLGEFGMNMMAVSWEDTTILIDAGVMFPDPDQLGVDLIIPDLTYLEARRSQIKALILTHGHEDHIGAVPHVLPYFDGPVYGTAMTLALVEPKLEEHGIDAGDRLKPVKPRETVAIGPLTVEFIRVTHSMPDCVALAITTPVGTIVHTGDFKIDQTPIDGEHFDLYRFAELGARGVLALFADSTNIDRKGFTGPEIEVIDAFEELFTSTSGKLVVGMFSSSIYRMQILVDLAVQFDRKVAFVGRSIARNSEIAQQLAFLRVPAGVQIRDADVPNYASQDVLCLATGSQGEPRAALSRISVDDHRFVRLGPDDVVVFSARSIPGNEKAIARTMSHVAPPGCGRGDRLDEARPRVGPWQRRGDEARPLARAPALLRPHSRRISAAVAARAGSQTRHGGRRGRRRWQHSAEAAGAAGAGRRHHPIRHAGRAHRRQGARGPRAHRCHPHR